MVLSPLALALLVLLPLALGAAGLRALGISYRSDRLGYLGWCWTLGSLALAALELVRLVAGLRSPVPLFWLAGLAAAATYALARRTPALAAAPRAPERAPGRLFFVATLTLALAVTVVRALDADSWAIVRHDEALFWSKRAKILFEAGGFGGVYARSIPGGRDLPNAGYPLLNPLLQLVTFDLAGRVTHVVNRLPLQLSSLALVLCTASALRRAAGPWLAGALLLLLVASSGAAYAARFASADVLVALGAIVALDGWSRWRSGGDEAWLGLAALSAAFLLWSKNEALLFVAAFALAELFARRGAERGGERAPSIPRARALAWCLPGVLVLAATAAHNTWFATGGNHAPWVGTSSGFAADLGRDLPATAAAFAGAFLAPSPYQAFVAFLALAALVPAARRGALAAHTLALVLVLAGLVVVYVAKSEDPSRLLRNTLDRVLFQLLPLSLLWLARVGDGLSVAAKVGARAPAGFAPTAGVRG